MADITKLLRLISGIPTMEDLTDDNLKLGSVALADSGGDHFVTIDIGENNTADRILTLLVNDAARTISLSGNLTVEAASTVNQDLTSDASPTFGGLTIGSLAGVLKGTAGVVSGSATMDDIADGATYGRVLLTSLTTNEVTKLTDSSGDDLTVSLGASNRVLTMSGNATLNQDVSSSGSPTFAKVTVSAAPVAGTDLTNKTYVDSVAIGLKDFKASVDVATTAALPANTASGAGVGKTLTADAVGVLTVDGVATVLGNRILVKNEVTGSDNGIYKVTTEGTAGVAYILTRATDADADDEVTAGLFVFVAEGTTNDNSGWVLATNDAITVDTTALSFVQFSNVTFTAGDGIDVTGTVISTDLASTGGLEIVSTELAIKLNGSTLTKDASGLKLADLADGKMLVGNASNVATAVTMSGDVTITNAGVAAITAGAILNADVNGSAAISADKLTDGATNAIITLTQETNFETAFSHVALTNNPHSVTLAQATAAGATTAVDITIGDASVLDSSAAPTTDPMIANKKYVDDQVGASQPEVLDKVVTIDETIGTVAETHIFAVRWALTGETAGRVKLADKDGVANSNVVGMITVTGADVAGTIETMVTFGTIDLGANDTAFGAGDVGKPVYLTDAGAFSVTPPSVGGETVFRIGIVENTTKIDVNIKQLNGVQ